MEKSQTLRDSGVAQGLYVQTFLIKDGSLN